MKCEVCGAEYGSEALFCTACGSKLERPEGAEAVNQQVSSEVTDLEQESAQEGGEPTVEQVVDEEVQDVAKMSPVEAESTGQESASEPDFSIYSVNEPVIIASPPSRGHRPLWITLGSILAFLLVAGILVFAFRWQLLQTFFPKAFVSLSLANTSMNVNGELDKTWLSKLDQGDQTEGDWTITLGEEAEGGELNLNWKYDRPGKQFLSSVDYANSWDDNMAFSLYLSPEQLLIRSKELSDDYDYIFVNFDSFTQDWENSALGEDGEAPDIEVLLQSMFGERNVDSSSLKLELRDELVAAWLELDKAMIYQSAGQVNLELAGENQALLAVDCRIPKEAATTFVQKVVQVYIEQMKYQSALGGYPLNDFEELDTEGISFSSDLSLRYLMDKNALVRQISLEPTMVKNEDTEEVTAIGFTLTMAGKDRVLDDMTLDISSQEEDSAKSTLTLLRKADLTAEGHYLQTFSIETDGKSQMVLTHNWESKGDQEGVFTISLAVPDGYTEDVTEVMVLSSEVKWEDGKITFSQGEITDTSYDSVIFTFEGTQKVLEPNSIQKPDQGEGVSIWEMMEQLNSSTF